VSRAPREAELTIERLASGGDGVGRLPDGRVAFVPFTAPGDRVRVRIVDERARHVHATVRTLLVAGPGRTDPLCAVFGTCGGCRWQHLDTATQNEAKRAFIEDALIRIAKLEPPDSVQLVPSPRPYGYRGRARLWVEGRGAAQGGGGRVGFRRARSHVLCPTTRCPVLIPALDSALAALAADPPPGDGEWELVADASGQVRRSPIARSAISEAASGRPIARSAISEAAPGRPIARSAISEAAPGRPIARSAISEAAPGRPFKLARASGAGPRPVASSTDPRGALPDDSAQRDLRSDVRPQDDEDALFVSPRVFAQGNVLLVDALVDAVLAAAGEGNLALELFAGAGLFTRGLARRFARVVAVEADSNAVRDLSANLRSAGLDNVTPLAQRAEDWLEQPSGLAPDGALGVRPDLVVLDPPRRGLAPGAAAALARLGAPRIVYLSCDPATWARDLGVLADRGYTLTAVTGFDLFPQTPHVEALAVMCRD
jgi:23S rRNA (uracil1939-C5)-methyltransferase